MNTSAKPNGPLTNAQIESFVESGFVVVGGFYDAGEMADITTWVEEVQNWPENPGEHMMYFEPSSTDPGRRILNRIENVHPITRASPG